jgi:diaminohydroxyphosphoribosylaminopyrimidine deaminase/5-amino-6-(5-phosphoribosylamino)uracil reductase
MASAADALWSLMLAVAASRRAGQQPAAFWRDAAGRVLPGHGASPADAGIASGRNGQWALSGRWPDDERPTLEALLALHAPLLATGPRQRYVVGHLGQSLDGRIATASGDSRFVNGPDNLRHLHRLRALCDAVLVGATTVTNDDPQLTTRHVSGPHPVRVVIDPSGRVTANHRICQDRVAPTWIAGRHGPADRAGTCHLPIAVDAAGVDLERLLQQLADRGVFTVLVEGGGITVSRFLAAGLLDRLHLAIAPLIIGSGRQGIQLPDIAQLCDGLRPRATVYPMGPDMLWDLALRD